MDILYYVFLGFAPAFFVLWYFYNKDKWEPEPKKQVIKIFILGIIAIIPAGILEYYLKVKVFEINTLGKVLIFDLIACFMIIGPVEEFFKYSVVKGFIYFDKDFNEKIDGVIYMVAAAMGFSAIENIMYIIKFGGSFEAATYIGLLRGAFSTPAHACFSGWFGVYLGEAKFANTPLKSIGFIFLGFIISIFLHGLYDLLAFTGGFVSIGIIPLLIISFYLLIKRVKKLSKESQFNPENN